MMDAKPSRLGKQAKVIIIGGVATSIALTLALTTEWANKTSTDHVLEPPQLQSASSSGAQATTLSDPSSLPTQLVSRQSTSNAGGLVEGAQTAGTSTNDWNQYENVPLDELKEEAGRLRNQLSEAKTPLLLAELDEGRSEYIGPAFEYNGTKSDRSDVFAIHYVPGKGTFRSLLSRAKFPELYELKAQIEGIEAIIAAKSHVLSQTAGDSRNK